MSDKYLNPSERTVLGSQYRLIAFADAVARCRNSAAMLSTHDHILNDENHEVAGIRQALAALRDDLNTISADLACMAVESRGADRPMAVRVKP